MTDPTGPWVAAAEIAAAVTRGAVSARAVTEAALARIAGDNPRVNAYTDVTVDRALAEARAIDAARAAGAALGPLAGVPFAVKNLFDIAGLPTRAGSKINRERAPATRDGVLLRRMTASGAVLLGGLNMGEYAYDFTGENAHDGACRNPHDPDRMTGGSSSGCGAATGAGLAPVSLGSDTNGSIRVPASLCGVFSLKPTYGRLPRTGAFPFVDSLDHLGPFARTAADLALNQPGQIIAVNRVFVNFGEIKNRSMDFVADYRLPWQHYGNFHVNLAASRTLEATRALAPGQPPARAPASSRRQPQ